MGYKCSTPNGSFNTIQEAAKSHGMSRQAVTFRLKSSNFLDWICPNIQKIKKGRPGIHRFRENGWKIADTSKFGIALKKSVQTPLGNFASIKEAAERFKVSAPTISNWCKHPLYKKEGFDLITIFKD